MEWTKLTPQTWSDNIFERISKDWMLICAGNLSKANAMTASFGGFGTLFFKPVAHIYVRPERHTYSLLEKQSGFSLAFFNGEAHRVDLQYCGKISGKDEDKLSHCGFTTQIVEGVPVIEQADISIICRTVYKQDIEPSLLTDNVLRERTYSSGGAHRMYVGEILSILQKKA